MRSICKYLNYLKYKNENDSYTKDVYNFNVVQQFGRLKVEEL